MATLELCAGFPSCLIQGGRKLTQSLRITSLSPPGRPLDGLVGRPAGILSRLEAICAPLGALLSCLAGDSRASQAEHGVAGLRTAWQSLRF